MLLEVRRVEIDAIAFGTVVAWNVGVIVDLLVTVEKRRARERFRADDARVVLLLGVGQNVLGEIVFREERLVAVFAWGKRGIIRFRPQLNVRDNLQG